MRYQPPEITVKQHLRSLPTLFKCFNTVLRSSLPYTTPLTLFLYPPLLTRLTSIVFVSSPSYMTPSTLFCLSSPSYTTASTLFGKYPSLHDSINTVLLPSPPYTTPSTLCWDADHHTELQHKCVGSQSAYQDYVSNIICASKPAAPNAFCNAETT